MQIQGFRCWNMIFKWWLLHTLIYRRVFHIREMGLANPKSWWCLNQVWFLSWHYHITTLVMVAKTFFHSLLYISLSLCVWMLVLFKWWKLRLFGGKSSRDSLNFFPVWSVSNQTSIAGSQKLWVATKKHSKFFPPRFLVWDDNSDLLNLPGFGHLHEQPRGAALRIHRRVQGSVGFQALEGRTQ